jgi:hypothetical protein
LLVGSLTTSTAGAAITASTITTPKDQSYFVYNDDSPNTFAISGKTTGGTTGDHVDIKCYYGTKTSAVATNVAVTRTAPSPSLRQTSRTPTSTARAASAQFRPGRRRPT